MPGFHHKLRILAIGKLPKGGLLLGVAAMRATFTLFCLGNFIAGFEQLVSKLF